MSSQYEKGLSLRDIDKQYNHDSYRNYNNKTAKTIQASQDFDEFYKPKDNLTVDNQQNLNIIETDSDMASNKTSVTVISEKKDNIDKKKEFAKKLRKHSQIFPKRNPFGRKANLAKLDVNRKKANEKPENRSKTRGSSSDSSYSSSAYSTESESSQSRSSRRNSKSVIPKTKNPSRQGSKQAATPVIPIEKPVTPKHKLTPDEKMEILKNNYQLQGFHPYYDKVSKIETLWIELILNVYLCY